MEDLIKRSDAIQIVKDCSFSFGDNYHEVNGFAAVKGLQSLPSAEPKQGEWIYTNDPLRLDDEWACSRCGNISFMKTNFCDRCGAQMKGADDATSD